MHPDGVEQPRIGELAREVATAKDPDILVACRLHQLGVQIADIAAGARHPIDGGDVPVGHQPGGLGVGPGELGAVLGELSLQPGVAGGAEHDGADVLGEAVEVQRVAVAVTAARVIGVARCAEQPREALGVVGDEPVQAGGGAVDGGHGVTVPGPTDNQGRVRP